MQSAQNMVLDNAGTGLGDQLVQQLQDSLEERRKTSTDVAKNPLALGDITQSSLGMAATMLGFGSPGGPGGPLAKTNGLV